MSSYRPMVTTLIRVALPILVICGMASLAAADVADHLILTEFLVKTRSGVDRFGSPFIEVANPTASDIDLSDVYITDGTQLPSNAYYNITLSDPETANPGGGIGGDFHAKFPDGYILAAGASLAVSINGSSEYFEAYAQLPDFELFEDSELADSVPEMVEAFPGSINAGAGGGSNEPTLEDGSESIILYTWDGVDELVQDLDYVFWGTSSSIGVDKTGVTIGSSSYLADTAFEDQVPVGTSTINFEQGYRRIDTDEGTETLTGGNGLTNHDETSENLDTTWALVNFGVDGHEPPAAPGSLFPTAPIVTLGEFSPEAPYEGQPVTLSVTSITEGTISAVTFFVSIDNGAFQSNSGTDQGGNLWQYQLASEVEGTSVRWYAELSNSGGGLATFPAAAPLYLKSWVVDEAPAVGDGPTKLLLTEICVLGSSQEFVEIYNPSAVDVDMSDYYLGDAIYLNNDQGYWNMGSGDSPPNIGGGTHADFQSRFPDGFVLAAGDTVVVSLGGSAGFSASFGFLPGLELYEDDAFPDAVPDMRPVFETATGNSIITPGENLPSLTNGSESVQLYHYNQGDDLVTDIDLFAWGSSTFNLFSKTNKTIGSSTYLPDTAVDSQNPFTTESDFGFSYQRTDVTEGNQITSGSNGVGGRDETSEDFMATFELKESDPFNPAGSGTGGGSEIGRDAIDLIVEAKTFIPIMELFPVRFVTMTQSDTRIRIFDLEGRLVVTLYDSRFDAIASVIPGAPSVVAWDGRDTVYERVKAGMYIIHMSVLERSTGEEIIKTAPVVVATRLSR